MTSGEPSIGQWDVERAARGTERRRERTRFTISLSERPSADPDLEDSEPSEEALTRRLLLGHDFRYGTFGLRGPRVVAEPFNC